MAREKISLIELSLRSTQFLNRTHRESKREGDSDTLGRMLEIMEKGLKRRGAKICKSLLKLQSDDEHKWRASVPSGTKRTDGQTGDW